ncbi:MAG: type II secretion system protein GspC [Aeromonadaceae bacterium]|nr:type II secretion system protein GspC [Aeromonadaceae bacterium]
MEQQLARLSSLLGKIPASRSSLALFWLLVIFGCQQMAAMTWQLLPAAPASSPVLLSSAAAIEAVRPLDPRELLKLSLFGKPEVKPVAPAKPVSTDPAPRTKLNLTLTGVLASSSPERSIAIVLNGGDEQGYGEGDVINGTQAIINSIQKDRIILDNQGQEETLMLDGEEYTPQASALPGEEDIGPDGPDPASVSKLKEDVAKNPGKLLDYINISPVISDGKLKGYRVNPGKDPAFFRRIGLQSNDLAVSINGYDLRDNSQAMQIMQQLSSMTEMNLTVERNGQQQDIYIRLTE